MELALHPPFTRASCEYSDLMWPNLTPVYRKPTQSSSETGSLSAQKSLLTLQICTSTFSLMKRLVLLKNQTHYKTQNKARGHSETESDCQRLSRENWSSDCLLRQKKERCRCVWSQHFLAVLHISVVGRNILNVTFINCSHHQGFLFFSLWTCWSPRRSCNFSALHWGPAVGRRSIQMIV